MRAGRYVDGRLPTTHWSLVARAGVRDDAAKREALGELLTRYMPALEAHLVHGKRLGPEEADDLLQDFIAGKVIEKDLIAQADREMGRFRTFLLTALDRFLIDTIRKESARKRSPGEGRLVAIGERADLLEAGSSPPDVFDVAWARRVVGETLRQMKNDCETSGRTDVWGVFEARIAQPALDGTEPLDYGTLVRRFGLKSPSQASNVLITGKRMFARALKAVVGEYTLGNEDIEIEIQDLRGILAKARA